MTDLLSDASKRTPEWVDLIGTLVDIDSGPGDRVGIASVYDVLDRELAVRGFDTERIATAGPDMMVARRPSKTPDAPRLALIGHADTVFAKGTPLERPFKTDADRMTGPGVADMKSGLVVLLGALQIVDDGVLDDLDLTVIINGDEESGSLDSGEAIVELASDRDAAFVFEAGRPPNIALKTRQGAHRFDVVVTGRAAHTGVNPEDGANAIEAVAHHILAVQELGRSTSNAIVTAVIVSGGTRPNIVPDHAVLRIDSRFDSDETEQRVVDAVEALAGDGPVRGTSTKVVSLDRRPAFLATSDGLARRYAESASTLGLHVEFAPSGGSSDGNFTSAAGVPTIDGVGAVGAGYHTVDEFVLTSSVPERAATFAELLGDIASEGL